jgi:phosphoribosylamine--glycine ligase
VKILVVGGGGREHALAWKCARSPRVSTVYVAPGNAGTATEPKCENVDIGAEHINALLAFALDRSVALTVVGPEAPLVDGIVDRFEAKGLRVFGPRAEAAKLEGSKSFTKDFLARHGIPSAAYGCFGNFDQARRYIEDRGAPVVVKADGLAAGKGVTVAATVEEAVAAARDCLVGDAFGKAGNQVVVEEFLEGEEASFIAVIGGGRIVPLATSQDHKAVGDGDTGPNTGGMGAYSPAPVVDEAMHARVMREVIEPTVQGLADEGTPFTGFLYAGLMIAPDGTPKVLEYNVRCGDPETQPIMMRLQSDLVDLLEAAIAGTPDEVGATWDPRVSLGVVLAAGGYPGSYGKGDPIEGLDANRPDTKVFHAGTRLEDGRVLTNGGRVLCVCALGDTVADAQSRAYDRATHIRWTDAYYRNDIGYRAVARERGDG